jgi:hypothetical protein
MSITLLLLMIDTVSDYSTNAILIIRIVTFME